MKSLDFYNFSSQDIFPVSYSHIMATWTETTVMFLSLRLDSTWNLQASGKKKILAIHCRASVTQKYHTEQTSWFMVNTRIVARAEI